VTQAPLAYITGATAGPDNNRAAFTSAAARLRAAGFRTWSVHDAYVDAAAADPVGALRDIYTLAQAQFRAADVVVTIDNSNSTLAVLAGVLGLPVVTLDAACLSTWRHAV